MDFIVCPNLSLDFVEKEAAPRGYRRAMSGDSKAPGLFGEGFGGEPLLVLLDGDDGKWLMAHDADSKKEKAGWK